MILRKFLAVLSAAAVAVSVMPAAFASAEPDENGVYYDEDFSGFSGTLAYMQPGYTSSDYTESHGMTFSTRSRAEGDYYQQTISISGGAVRMYVAKYANDTQPTIALAWTSGVTFEHDRVINFDVQGEEGTPVVIKDSTGKELTLALPNNKWLTYTVASQEDSTAIIIADRSTGETVNYSKSSVVLKDVASFTSTKSKTFTYTIDNIKIADADFVIPDELVLDAAVSSLKIAEGQMGMTVDGDVFHVKRDVTLPEDPDGAAVEWSVSQRPIDDDGAEWTETSYASVSDGSMVLSATGDCESYYVKLTANVSVNDLSDIKEFLFVVEKLTEEERMLRYDEDFSGVATGGLVDLGKSSNSDYAASLGMTFGCGSRDQDTSQLGMRASTDANMGTYIDFYANKYQAGKQPFITLSRSQGIFENGIFVSADVKYAVESCGFVIKDSANNVVTVNVPGEEYLSKWLHVTVAVVGSSASIVVKDEDGNVIYYGHESTKLKNVKNLTTTDVKIYSSFGLDNVYIADKAYEVPDSEIVEAAKLKLDLSLKYENSAYNASTNFDLPEAPTGTTVSWKVMQKAKTASEWEESPFIQISGTSAVIKPTKDVDDYDVKLVAKIASGDASDTKDFAISLPNPMDEINGILDNNFGLVNTTDTDKDGNTITFDLNGTEMLKRDLALPLNVKAYKNATIAWTSSDDSHISIDDNGTATIMTSDLDAHDVTLTAVITYKKDDITYTSEPKEFKIKVGFEESDRTSGDDTLGKYRVRYDAAYSQNFSSIPSSTTANISLPSASDMRFGSTLTWSSSAPTIISNSGAVTRQSAKRTVDLTAIIMSGSASQAVSFPIVVYGTESSGGSGGGGGGGGGGGTVSTTGTINRGTSSGTISTPKSTAALPATINNAAETVSKLQEEALASNDTFKDIAQAAWARDAINGLAAKGVINGKSDTEFAPNDTVTRAEFAKMLMGAFGLVSEAYTTSSFYDVPVSAWYFQYVEAAYNLGIIQGTGNGIFESDALITRQDMAVMVARAAVTAGKDLTVVRDMLGFADSGRIAAYAAEAVEQLVRAGVMSGKSDTEFAPLENATRAQAAQILFNLVG